MSIPPLVCNTPPPIDQCDDDKDQEDFDLRYNLSQEDDDSNEYDYNGFSSYNNFQSVSNKNEHKEDLPKISFNLTEPSAISSSTVQEVTETEIKSNCKMKLQDEVNLEDLDLKLDRVSINSDKENQGENNNNLFADKESSTDISEESNIEGADTKKMAESELSIDEDLLSKDENDESIANTEEIEESKVLEKCHILLESTQADVFSVTPTCVIEQEENEESKSKEAVDILSDDEFGDFDDFKLVSTEKAAIPINDNVIEDPWSGQEWSEKNNTPHFEAAFGDFVSVENSEMLSMTKTKVEPEDNDDFGDFDDFQSTSVEAHSTSDTSEPVDQGLVFNLHSAVSDQAIEKVIFSIFEKNESDPESKFDSKLESFLSETWRHLKETDIRQPYLVNWNSSIAQKTLLKALCIDSRNILFGPKWAHNMPRYAVTLGPAPLLPQKPTTAVSESPNPEKPSTKSASADTWVDPFTSVGQEFTYAEALLLDLEHLMATLDQMAHNHSSNLKISELLSQHACTTEAEPAPLAHGLPAAPSGPAPAPAPAPGPAPAAVVSGEIYSATLNIQPMRQISLPDTHIFTPTDSEIPRSKTIHYDHSPTIILPERKPSERLDTDFSDFQDFREAISSQELRDAAPTAAVASAPKINILEPIKIEPIVPQLNWPDPGQVKETFEDFSDFISNSSSDNNKQNTKASSVSNVNITSVSEKTSPKQITNIIQNKSDDDFESFQSVIPSSQTVGVSDSRVAEVAPKTKAPQVNQAVFDHETVTKPTDFDLVFSMSESNSIKFNDISPSRTSISSDISPKDLPVTADTVSFDATKIKPKHNMALTSSFTNQILQPTSTGLSAAQSKPDTTQILQPLSLEGYSQINWPDPGLDLQDLSRFNPVEKLPSLQGEPSAGGGALSKAASPAHARRGPLPAPAPAPAALEDDDLWGEFVSSRPAPRTATPNKQQTFVDNDEWTDFVSSPSVKPTNGVNTISFNVYSNSSLQKPNKYNVGTRQKPIDIPTLNYITPKTANPKTYSDKHFQNL